jgi:hypothetical protein
VSADYFTTLGLVPGQYDPAEIERRFRIEQARWVAATGDPARYAVARRRLDELHLAYAVLHDPFRQAEYVRARGQAAEAVGQFRQRIQASLEDGLLRHSRRQELLAAGRRLGFSEFHTHLLIAQVQFGDEQGRLLGISPGAPGRPAAPRSWAGFAAAGVLALAMFLVMLRWLAP